MTKRHRYIKRNAIDYVLLAVLVLLALSLLLRGVDLYLTQNEDRSCTATVSFTVRGLDYETAMALRHADTFRFFDSSLSLEGATYVDIRQSTDTVQKEDGSFEEAPLSDRFDLFFSASADGIRARDGGFLLSGVRRLATGDSATLIAEDAKYTVSFSRVQISP